MNLEERMACYRKSLEVPIPEETIQETIRRSKNAFYKAEQEGIVSYHEFLWIQLKCMPKKWWAFQSLILAVLWMLLNCVPDEELLVRSLGVASSLFVILIIPELWKNRLYGCMEIEAASYYTLRQIYAARMLLFGMADILMLTLFCGAASAGLRVGMSQLLIQFLFPLCVTAGICFGLLCSRYFLSETAAVVGCIVWNSVWMFVILDGDVYERIAMPVWVILMGLVILFTAFVIYRILANCDRYLEEVSDEAGT